MIQCVTMQHVLHMQQGVTMCYNLTHAVMCYNLTHAVLQFNNVLHIKQEQRFCCLASLTVGGTQQQSDWQTVQTPVCGLIMTLIQSEGHKQTNKQEHKQAIKQTSKQTGTQANKQTETLANRHGSSLTGKQTKLQSTD